MAEYDIDQTAVAATAALLRDLLQTEVPSGDFTQGSAASDILIDGHAIVAGYLSNQIKVVRQRQSLLTLQDLPASESVNDAADAILDNFFRTRSQGSFSKGVATLRFNQRLDVLIPRQARFFKTSALIFYIDSDVDILVSAADLRPDINANGIVTSYSTTVFLTASTVGTEYNIDPGKFASFDRFNANLVSVENLSKFSYGTSIQSTADFILKSTNAIALRALINSRSNDAVLLEQYAGVEATTTIGYGDPEMMRDLVQNVSNTVAMHVGGHMDIFARQNVQEVVERLPVGLLQARNDGKAIILRHQNTTPSASFILAGVIPGDVLVMLDGAIPEAPFQFRVSAVRETEIEVDLRTPFSIATDELQTARPIRYTVGNNYPAYNNKAQVLVATADATTSRKFSQFNSFQLPAAPTYAIKNIELLAPVPSALLPYADAFTGNVNFTVRKNAPTLTPPGAGSQLDFYVSLKNPLESQSSRAVTMVELGWPAVDLTGSTVDVTYETPTGFATVNTYVNSRLNRPACSNTLLRARHPIYLYFSVPYRPRTTPVDPLQTVIPVFDATAAAASLTSFINAYRQTEPLDVSLLATNARDASAAVAAIYTFTVQYELIIPDGRVMRFATEDKITVFPDEVTSTARLINAADFGLPASGYALALQKLLVDQGLSDRLTRYRALDEAVVFERRA
jgi:hypothetical protein